MQQPHALCSCRCSQDRDGAEVAELLQHLADDRGAEAFAICGHSTGCQIAVHFMAGQSWQSPQRDMVRLLVLQAPVSDREAASTAEGANPAAAEMAAEAEALASQGQSQRLLTELLYGSVPITAARYLSLTERGGMDDMHVRACLAERERGAGNGRG